MTQFAIDLTHVTKTYPLPDGSAFSLYEDLHFSVKQGCFASLMGTSGSGKSTLLNMIAGIVLPDKGHIRILGKDITTCTDEERTLRRGQHIGFIFQSFNLLPYLTVEQNIDLVLDLNDLPRRFSTQEIASLVGLGDKLNRYPQQLSGGEQQRVGIARALVGQTDLILADEPTGNLDEKTAAQIMNLLQDLHKRIGCTIVLITHDPQVAAQAEVSLRLEGGKVI